MIDTLRSEWIKLHTVRMHTVLWIIAVAFPLVVVVLTTALIDTDDMDGADLIGVITLVGVFSGLLLGVMSVSSITSEFNFNTIRPTFAATPNRIKVMIAKSVVAVVVTLVISAATAFGSFVVGAGILGARGGDAAFGDAGDSRFALVGLVLLMTILSLLGLGLGLLVRNTAAAVAILVLWPLVAEGLIAALLFVAGFENAGKWLPYNAGFSLVSSDSGQDESLGRVAGGLYFFVVTSIVAAIGTWTTASRDA